MVSHGNPRQGAAAATTTTTTSATTGKLPPVVSGKVGARDRTTGDDPVTNFRRSNRIYRTAMSWNKGLDRDKDGIACEKA
jgi:hypothetical protein